MQFGLSDKTIDKISSTELQQGLAAYPSGFVVRGTLQQYKGREQALGIANYRGLVFERGIDFAEDGLRGLRDRLQGYEDGKSLVLVHVSAQPQYILFVVLLSNQQKFEQSFAQACQDAVRFADRSCRQGSLHMGLAFEHVMERVLKHSA